MVKKPNVRKEMFPVVKSYIEVLKVQKEMAKSFYKEVCASLRQQERGLAKLQKRYDKQ